MSDFLRGPYGPEYSENGKTLGVDMVHSSPKTLWRAVVLNAVAEPDP